MTTSFNNKFLMTISILISLLFGGGEVWGFEFPSFSPTPVSPTCEGRTAFEQRKNRYVENAERCGSVSSSSMNTVQQMKQVSDYQIANSAQVLSKAIGSDGMVNPVSDAGAANQNAGIAELGNNQKLIQSIGIYRNHCQSIKNYLDRDLSSLQNANVCESLNPSTGQYMTKIPSDQATASGYAELKQLVSKFEFADNQYASAQSKAIENGYQGFSKAMDGGDQMAWAKSIMASSGANPSEDSKKSDIPWGTVATVGAIGAGLAYMATSSDSGDSTSNSSAKPGSAEYCDTGVNYKDTRCASHFTDKCESSKSSSACKSFTTMYCGQNAGYGSNPGSDEDYCQNYYMELECSIPANRETPACEQFAMATGTDLNSLCPSSVSKYSCDAIAGARASQTAFDSLKDKCSPTGDYANDATCQYFRDSFPNAYADATGESTNTTDNGTVVVYDQGCSSVNGCTSAASIGSSSQSSVGAQSVVAADVGSSFGSTNEQVVSSAMSDICAEGRMFGCIQ
ncbi:MAG: hypothetical protein KDD50_05340 [Bdellovibrionales bacterium]|nr:hypothetical protein [Bdellovibrionales bacterium]